MVHKTGVWKEAERDGGAANLRVLDRRDFACPVAYGGLVPAHLAPMH